jgi:hypothetical protein
VTCRVLNCGHEGCRFRNVGTYLPDKTEEMKTLNSKLCSKLEGIGVAGYAAKYCEWLLYYVVVVVPEGPERYRGVNTRCCSKMLASRRDAGGDAPLSQHYSDVTYVVQGARKRTYRIQW